MKRAVILFTRAPIAGKTKTRMMPRLSPDECAALHRRFLLDIQETLSFVDTDVYIFHASEGREEEDVLKNIWKKPFGRLKGYFPQQGETLGFRMFQAISYVLKDGYQSCVLIGSDVPELSARDIETAFQRLEEKDVVFGRTKDGGYYLVGMNRPLPQAFGLSSYGHGKVLAQTISHIEKEGFSVGFTGSREDMDVFEDLLAYIQRGRKDPRLAMQNTFSYVLGLLRISVIIPIYNEEKTVPDMKRQLDRIQQTKEAFYEVIFVDGGSVDSTLSLLGKDYPVFPASKSRARQMNRGAKKSSGDILFFLHCDSVLPPFPRKEILSVISQNPIGCFGIRFLSHNLFMYTCRWLSNFRAEKRRLPFGDQGIFLDRKLFFKLGMFPDIPIMEDYQFALTLRSHGIPVKMTSHRLITSGRRFPEGTVPKLRLMWKMYCLRAWYRRGVSPKKLSKMYEDIR